MKILITAFFALVIFSSCKKDKVPLNPNEEAYYFPPLQGAEWQTKTASALGWNETKLQEAFDFAGTKNTYGLIVLHKGKIVKEQYWNQWNTGTRYYIASAGKSMLAFVAGIAQQHGLIAINNKTSDYLGTGWTSLPLAKENLITVKNQLTMTTGLNDAVTDPDCITPACLTYKADAGNRWAYHNAPYLLLQNVLANASGKTWNAYCKEVLFDKIGISGALWYNGTLFCTTRDIARFGSLILNNGKWEATNVLSDAAYFNAMVNTSQNLNLSYGYLWWLNGKASAMLPQSQVVFNTSLAPDAPADMIMALGKDDKKIYVVPSLDLVVVRLGDDAGTGPAGPSSFDNELWLKLKPAIGY